MGVDYGDYDGDGDEDLFITKFDGETNTLYRNDGKGQFLDATAGSGLGEPSFRLTGFGARFLDYDNDGRLDLVVTNGRVVFPPGADLAADPYPMAEPNLLFHNDGGGVFSDRSAEAGAAFTTPMVGRGLATGDVDDDGDTDVLVTASSGPVRLFLNRVGERRPWVGVRLVGTDARARHAGRDRDRDARRRPHVAPPRRRRRQLRVGERSADRVRPGDGQGSDARDACAGPTVASRRGTRRRSAATRRCARARDASRDRVRGGSPPWRWSPPSSARLPPPALGGLEPAIERQLLDARSAVDRLSADGDATPRDLAAAYGSLGELYLLYDLARDAEPCLREAAARDPAEPRWPYLLGVLLQGEGELEGAATAFRATLALRDDDVAARLRLGDVLLDGARAEEARAVFARALEIEPRSAKALDGLGRAAFAVRDYDQAIARFEGALALQPAASSVHYRLGMAYRARGDAERARLHLEQSGEGPVTFPDPVLDAAHRRVTGVGALIVVGQLAARAGAAATAEARFREALALDPKSPEAHHALGAFYEEQGRTGEALEHYVAALDLGLANSALGLHAGRLLRETGRAGEAVAILERAASSAPDSSLIAAELAAALAAAGDRDRALDAYGRAIALEGDARSRALLYFRRAGLLADARPRRPKPRPTWRRRSLSRPISPRRTSTSARCARAAATWPRPRPISRARSSSRRRTSRRSSRSAWRCSSSIVRSTRALDSKRRSPSVPTTSRSSICWRDCWRRRRSRRRATPSARWRSRASWSRRSRAALTSRRWRWRSPRRVASTRRSRAQERAVAAADAGAAASAADRERARRRLALYREGRAVVDPWKE